MSLGVGFARLFSVLSLRPLRALRLSLRANQELKQAAGRDKDQAHIAALERFLKGRKP